MRWNSELYPQLGNIAGIQEIDTYLRAITFRRRLLGCDLEEVQECLSEVSRQYKAIIASLLSLQGQDEQIQALQAGFARLSQENAALGEWGKWFEQAHASLLAENGRLRQENLALQAERAQRGYFQ